MAAGRVEHKPYFYRRLLLIVIGLATFAAPGLVAQASASQNATGPQTNQSATSLPEFEVASVRPQSPNERELNGLYTYPGGKIIARGCRIKYLIMVAFDVQHWQILGGPSWTDLVSGAAYDIQAKPPDSSPSSKLNPAIAKNPPSDEQRQMLQALLIDRFQLKFHRETKEGTIYILMKGNNSLKLQLTCPRKTQPVKTGVLS